jgi:hypothetical protein
MSKRVWVVLTLFSLLPVILALQGIASAQETMSASQDPSQHQVFGQWRVGNAKYPGILVRAKCSYDVQIDGKWSSWWDFQLKSTYPASMDYVFNYEYGVPESQVNQFGAPSMITAAKSGDMYFNGTELWGTCGQHTLIAKRLHITVACAVPTGQDAPCFKDSSGNPTAAAKDSGSAVGPLGAQNGHGGKLSKSGTTGSKLAQAFWYCTVDHPDPPSVVVYSSVFAKGLEPGVLDSEADGMNTTSPLALQYGKQFEQMVASQHPDWTGRGPYCYAYKSQQEAQAELEKDKEHSKDLGDHIPHAVNVLNWSPK